MSPTQAVNLAILQGARRLLVDMACPFLHVFDEVIAEADRERWGDLHVQLATWYQSGGAVGDERYYWASRAVRLAMWGGDPVAVCSGLCERGPMPVLVTLVADGLSPDDAVQAAAMLNLAG